MTFEKGLYANVGSLLVGYKFDGDINDNVCRLAFYGNILVSLKHEQMAQPNLLKIFRFKSKNGMVEKVVDRYTVLVKDLFEKDVNINNFIGREMCL
jgi:selenocysteine-specific elongation factor